MESKHLTAQESLDIITTMIRQAQGNVKKNSFYFLLWGWVVALANTGMFILTQMQYQHPYIVWIITIPAWLFTLFRALKHGSAERNVTHFDRISASLWISFGVIVFTLVLFGSKINYQLNPVILILSAIPTFASGIILKFKPLLIGGVVFYLGGIAGFLVPQEMQSLIGAIAITAGYLIPGYLLKSKHAQNV